MKTACATLALVACLQTACGVKVGLVGDSGYSTGSRKTFDVMRAQGVDVVVHNGDFDYKNDPRGWDQFLDTNWLNHGKKNLLMAQGNHDLRKWSDYKQRLYAKINPSGMTCKGRGGQSLRSVYGEWMSCIVEDTHIIVLGWNAAYEFTKAAKYVRDEFSASTATWKVAVWHRPEGTYNPGPRYTNQREEPMRNEWLLYEACKAHGAIIVGGHTHLYSRSKLMTDFKSRTVARDNNGALVGLDCGKSIDVISGMSGASNVARGKRRQRAYVQARYNRRAGKERNGVLICDFPNTKNGGGERATCEFRVGGAPGQVVDRFQLTQNCRNH